MPIKTSGSENLNKSNDVSISFSKGNDQLAAFGSVGIHGYKDATNFPKPTPSTFNAASATLGVGAEAGHSASLTETHIPNFGKQVTGAMNVNVLKTDNHKVDVNAFTTKNFPSGPGPNFHTHGGGVQYQYKDIATAAASAAHIPIAKRTDYSGFYRTKAARNSNVLFQRKSRSFEYRRALLPRKLATKHFFFLPKEILIQFIFIQDKVKEITTDSKNNNFHTI